MSHFSAIYAAFLITLLASAVTSATTNRTTKPPQRKSYAQNVKQFAISVGQGFRSIALSIKRLSDFHRPIKSPLQKYLIPSLKLLKSLEPVCPDGLGLYGTRCLMFAYCTGACSVNEARKSCARKESRLAKVSTASDEQFFMRMLKTSKRIIYGGNDRDTEGTWRWPDGSLVQDGYTNWESGEPGGGSTENCMDLYVPDKKWYDVSCSYEFQVSYNPAYVCETSPNFL